MNRTSPRHALPGALAILCLSLAACGGGDDAPGMLSVSIYGEDLVEDGIPADELVDGWEITFDRFLVSVGDVRVAAAGEPPAIDDGAYRIFDLARSSGGDGHPLLAVEVPGGFYEDLGYRIAPAAAAVAGNAEAADVDLMTGGGFSIYAEGVAVKDQVAKTFAWGFTGATRYGACEAGARVDGGEAGVEITIHADHLFYDDLVAEEPNLAFDLKAAADDLGNADGIVSEEELAAIDIRDQARYQVGPFSDVIDLWTFIDRQSATVGHVDGEGHCDDAIRE
jgi:hypothetical protein